MDTASILQGTVTRPRPATRRRSGTTQPTQGCPSQPYYNGFLNHRFEPFWAVDTRDWRTAEREFFSSLSHLCRLYRWCQPDVKKYGYPENVAMAFTAIKERAAQKNLTAVIARDPLHGTSIVTLKQFDTGYMLYYIPCRPLWLLLQDKQQQAMTDLLLCLYRWYYHEHGVSYFREGSYIEGEYATIEDWIEEDTDGDEDPHRQQQLREMAQLKAAGDELLPHLKKPFLLSELTAALHTYHQQPKAIPALITVATDIIQFCGDYPGRRIGDRMHSNLWQEPENERICLEQYLAFFWSAEDSFYELLIEIINGHLQEQTEQEEPSSLQWFDTPQPTESHDFTYEQRFFKTINDLSGVLYPLDATLNELI